MKITRFNSDMGNSMYMNYINGVFFEIPTNVVELSKAESEEVFTNSIDDPKDLIDRLLISTEIDGEEKFYLVGEIANNHIFGNRHINKLHNKVTSPIPLVMFLAATAFFKKLNEEDDDTNEVHIELFQTMLPIWLLKKLNKFSEMQDLMSQRFKGTHTVKILTLGMESEITITVEEALCRIESEVARMGIKKGLDLADKKEAKKYDEHYTVIFDMGGGTDDAVLLPPGLKSPTSKDSFIPFTDYSYLQHLEELRKSKLAEHFSDLRSLDKFIYSYSKKEKMELINGVTGEATDLTDVIKASLKDYAKIKITQAIEAFPIPKGTFYKYLYIGGVAEILQPYIEEVAIEMFGKDLASANHIVPPNARTLNIDGLEIISRDIEQKRQNASK
ncbi:ParM/StbA family protein [Bacillus pumilus]|uniref:Alp7A family actin-like protein n=1 Tax=Bacillus TaxID=1386 RepID=UPI001C21AB1A|nr:ParM/StbA family protein [Bacillus pumilus]